MSTSHTRPLTGMFVAAMAFAFLYWAKPPVALGIDRHDIRCLPNVRGAILWKVHPKSVKEGDYLIFHPNKELAYVKDEFVFKIAAGVPGDHLVIKGDQVLINGKLVVSGLPLANMHHVSAESLQRDEVIPEGHYFMIGTHPLSDDSRYWGYLADNEVAGTGYPVF